MLIDIVPEKTHIKPVTITTSELSQIIRALELFLAYHNNDGKSLPISFMMPYPTFYTPSHKKLRAEHIGQLIDDLNKIYLSDMDDMVDEAPRAEEGEG